MSVAYATFLLGVSATASEQEIGSAFRRTVRERKLHPDQHKGDANDFEDFNDLKKAHDVLVAHAIGIALRQTWQPAPPAAPAVWQPAGQPQ